MIAARFPDAFDVAVELIEAHAPVVEVVAAHGGMIGEADFSEAQLHGARGILRRLAGGVPAERGVHVVIGREFHACAAWGMMTLLAHCQEAVVASASLPWFKSKRCVTMSRNGNWSRVERRNSR